MLEMGEGKSGEKDGKTDEGSRFGQETKSDQGTDQDSEFEVPALLDSAHCQGKNPSNDGIEKGVVADGTMESDIHWEKCGKCGGGESYVLAAKSPDSGEINAQEG
jgi:hypothetical protein